MCNIQKSEGERRLIILQNKLKQIISIEQLHERRLAEAVELEQELRTLIEKELRSN